MKRRIKIIVFLFVLGVSFYAQYRWVFVPDKAREHYGKVGVPNQRSIAMVARDDLQAEVWKGSEDKYYYQSLALVETAIKNWREHCEKEVQGITDPIKSALVISQNAGSARLITEELLRIVDRIPELTSERDQSSVLEKIFFQYELLKSSCLVLNPGLLYNMGAIGKQNKINLIKIIANIADSGDFRHDQLLGAFQIVDELKGKGAIPLEISAEFDQLAHEIKEFESEREEANNPEELVNQIDFYRYRIFPRFELLVENILDV